MNSNKKIMLIAFIIILILSISLGITIFIDNKNKEKRETQSTDVGELETINKILDETPEDIIGEGSEQSPYLIQSIEDLVIISNKINSGKIEKGKIYSIETDLDFKSKNSYVDSEKVNFLNLGDINKNGIEEPLMQELTTGEGFEPIGKDINNVFSGEIKGNGHTISNLYIKNVKSYCGLIGVVSASDKNQITKISNLIIKNAKIDGNSAGALIGYIYDTHNIVIENCNISEGTIKGKSAVGGMIGEAYSNSIKMYNCKNSSNITGKIAGGIIGIAPTNIEIEKGINEGIINGEFFAAGIIGDASSSNANIKLCYNKGNVKGNVTAGIVCGKTVTIQDTFNEGLVEGNHIGAIVSNTNTENLNINIERSYYLKGTAGRGIKGIEDIEGKVEMLEQEEMKEKLQELINF